MFFPKLTDLQYYYPWFFEHSLESWNGRTTQATFLTSLLAFLFSLSSKGTGISKESQKKSLSALASAVACSFLKSC